MTTHLYFNRLLVLISENIHDQVLDTSYAEIFSYFKKKKTLLHINISMKLSPNMTKKQTDVAK